MYSIPENFQFIQGYHECIFLAHVEGFFNDDLCSTCDSWNLVKRSIFKIISTHFFEYARKIIHSVGCFFSVVFSPTFFLKKILRQKFPKQ